MDNLGNQNNENNGAKSGKSFGDLLRALNDFQDSLGELMDDNKLCEFKFTKGIIAYGAGYHIGIPDGFKINRESKNANGDRRDFLAWLPDEFEKKDFMIGEADEDKPVELLQTGRDKTDLPGDEYFRNAFQEMLDGGVNPQRVSTKEYSYGEVKGGYIRRVMSSMCCNYYIIVGMDGNIIKFRMIFNNKYTVEDMDRAADLWLETLRIDGNDAANEEAEKRAAEKAEQDRLEAERIAAEKAEQERLEAERIAAEKAEQERLEAERISAEKAEQERLEAERIAAEKAEQERIEAEKAEAERARKAEEERIAAEKAEAERIAAEEAERARKEAEEEAARIEAERIAAEKARREEEERIAAEKAAKEEASRLREEEEQRATKDAINAINEEVNKAKEEQKAAQRKRKAAEDAQRAELEKKAAEDVAKEIAEAVKKKAAIENRVVTDRAATFEFTDDSKKSESSSFGDGATATENMALRDELAATEKAEAAHLEAERQAEKIRREEFRQKEEQKRQEEKRKKEEEKRRQREIERHAEELRKQEVLSRTGELDKLKAHKEDLIRQRVDAASEINQYMLDKAEIEKEYDQERSQFMMFENQINTTLFNAQGKKKELEAAHAESEAQYEYKEQSERRRLLKLKDDLRTAFAYVEICSELEAIFREKAQSGRRRKVMLYKQKTAAREDAQEKLETIRGQYDIAIINSNATIKEHQEEVEKYNAELAIVNDTIERNTAAVSEKKAILQSLKDKSAEIDEKKNAANQRIRDIESEMRDIEIKIRQEEAKNN